jgi:hypothetical protein
MNFLSLPNSPLSISSAVRTLDNSFVSASCATVSPMFSPTSSFSTEPNSVILGAQLPRYRPKGTFDRHYLPSKMQLQRYKTEDGCLCRQKKKDPTPPRIHRLSPLNKKSLPNLKVPWRTLPAHTILAKIRTSLEFTEVKTVLLDMTNPRDTSLSTGCAYLYYLQ